MQQTEKQVRIKVQVKKMNNEYNEIIEFKEDEEGIFCFGRRNNFFWCDCAFVFAYHGM